MLCNGIEGDIADMLCIQVFAHAPGYRFNHFQASALGFDRAMSTTERVLSLFGFAACQDLFCHVIERLKQVSDPPILVAYRAHRPVPVRGTALARGHNQFSAPVRDACFSNGAEYFYDT